jgi:hypothetical protein
MRRNTILTLTLGFLAMNLQGGSAMAQTTVAPTHVSNSFQFVLQEPLSRAAPLFGPQAELCWAGENWKPEFVHPQPGEDVEGAVFLVQHGRHKSVWVNTIFDLAGGRMQYVAIIPEVVAFVVDVRLTAAGASSTNVAVTYVRTALDAVLNGDVEAMGKRDRESGPEWKRDIESCLKGQSGDAH